MVEQDEELSRVFRALSDTMRRRIVDELGKRDGQSLFELYTRVVINHGTGQSRQGFSRHLAVLEEAGIITVQWQGTTKLHYRDTKPLAQLKLGWLGQFQEGGQ